MQGNTIKNIISVSEQKGIKAKNLIFLSFLGSANGTNLGRNYNNASIKSKYVRIIDIYFAFYSPSSGTWLREVAYDNQTFTPTGNARYSLLRPNTRLDINFLEENSSTPELDIYYDSQNLNLFPSSEIPFFDHMELNVIPEIKLQDGIDIKITANFYSNVETPTLANPLVNVLLRCQLFDDLNAQVII